MFRSSDVLILKGQILKISKDDGVETASGEKGSSGREPLWRNWGYRGAIGSIKGREEDGAKCEEPTETDKMEPERVWDKEAKEEEH